MVLKFTHLYVHTCIHICAHSYIHTSIKWRSAAAAVCPYTHAQVHTYKTLNIHTYIHTYIHTAMTWKTKLISTYYYYIYIHTHIPYIHSYSACWFLTCCRNELVSSTSTSK